MGAGLFARAGLDHYRSTHSLIGAAFLGEQLWIVAAYVVRRRATVVSGRWRDWLLAFAGTFAGVLFRPTGAHPRWGIEAGMGLQVMGLAICVASFVALGRSFGFAPADRGVKQRGPYAVVRHPIYASYFLLLGGYVLQSMTWRNLAVMLLVCSCDVGRALSEERLLSSNVDYMHYREHVRWRMLPGVW
jgi:protein-S-isoprenylcysteine O-methyltransferase Ste14